MSVSRERFAEAVHAIMDRWDEERDDDDLWLEALRDGWNLDEFIGAGLAEAFSDEARLEVEVYLIDPSEAFIVAVRGSVDVASLAEIEKAIQPSVDDYYAEGCGSYLVFPEHFGGQRGDEGRWEIAPGWGADPSEVKFLGPIPGLAENL